jgi:DNA-binding transcriptional ArsR family regulator
VKANGLSQSNVSNHLGCLRDCGLVVAQQNWRYVTYRLSDDRVGELMELAESLLSDVARGVYECVRYNSSKD